MSKVNKVRSCYGCEYYYLAKEEYEKYRGLAQQTRHNCPYPNHLECGRFNGKEEETE